MCEEIDSRLVFCDRSKNSFDLQSLWIGDYKKCCHICVMLKVTSQLDQKINCPNIVKKNLACSKFNADSKSHYKQGLKINCSGDMVGQLMLRDQGSYNSPININMHNLSKKLNEKLKFGI